MSNPKVIKIEPDPVSAHNQAIEAEAFKMLRSGCPIRGPQLTLAENDKLTRLMRGIVLNVEYLDFSSQIAIACAQSFYESLQDVKKLLNRRLSLKERLALVTEFLDHFADSANEKLAQSVVFTPPLRKDEVIFKAPELFSFKQPKKVEKERKGKRYPITLGEHREGRRLEFDRFGQHYNQCVLLNMHDDAIKGSFPLRQIYVIAHEGGHALQSFIRARSEKGMAVPPYMSDMELRTRISIDHDVNFEAYRASATEQYADALGHIVIVELFNQLIEDGYIKRGKRKTIVTEELKNSLGTIGITRSRTQFPPPRKYGL